MPALNAPQVDRSALERHPNGVSGLNEIVATAENPLLFKSLLEQVANTGEVLIDDSGLAISAGSGKISVLTPSA